MNQTELNYLEQGGQGISVTIKRLAMLIAFGSIAMVLTIFGVAQFQAENYASAIICLLFAFLLAGSVLSILTLAYGDLRSWPIFFSSVASAVGLALLLFWPAIERVPNPHEFFGGVWSTMHLTIILFAGVFLVTGIIVGLSAFLLAGFSREKIGFRLLYGYTTALATGTITLNVFIIIRLLRYG